jgi:dTDP-4-amino-4,6-dideoxygalactose transaminase
VDLRAQYWPLRETILDAITRVCDSQRFILGPEVEALEASLAALIGVKHAIGVSSGTDALLMSLMALGVGPGDEVLTSACSFFATAGVVARLGARPRFVDIDPQTFTLQPSAIDRVLTPRTKAIVPVHLFGQPSELDPILDVASRAGVPVIEDAAQAIGARYKDRQVGTFGAAGCFSFFPSKNLGAFGDAGLIVTNDDAMAHTLRTLREHGGERKYHHEMVGGNFRLDALQAAVLRVKLPHLAEWTAARRANAARYNRLFGRVMAERPVPVSLPMESPSVYHVYNQYVIRIEGERREASAQGRKKGCAPRASGGARHCHGGVLSGAAAASAVLRTPRVPPRRFSVRRRGRP